MPPFRTLKVTGERVVTPNGGHNPTWQRHVAAYRVAAGIVGGAFALDLGCGIGHSHMLLGLPTIGLDIDHESLLSQGRAVVRSDMRALPFRAAALPAIVSVQSLEHVPDPERTVSEAGRALQTDGTAVFVTPNRLTFGLPNEIIDPWHYIEFDADQLRKLCEASFGSVELLGIFGSTRYLELWDHELRRLHHLIALDPWRLRRHLSRRSRQRIYATMTRWSRHRGGQIAASISDSDFALAGGDLATALDLVAVCRLPLRLA